MKKLFFKYLIAISALLGLTSNVNAQIITVANLTDGLSPNPISLGQNGLVLFGFSITVTGNTSAVNVRQINLKTAVGDAQSFFSNGKLFRSNTVNSYEDPTLFTQVAGASTSGTVEIYTNQTRIIFSTPESFPANISTTKYYFFVADFTVTYGTGANVQYRITNNQDVPFLYYGNGTYDNPTNPSNSATGTNYNIGRTLHWRVSSNTTSWGTGGNWSNANNEAQSTPPGQYDNVVIGEVSRYNGLMPILSSSTTVNKVTFGNNYAPELTINSGATLTANGGIVVNTSTSATILGSGGISLSSGSSSSLASGSTLTTTPSITNAGTFAVGNGNLTINNNLTNSGTFTQTGTGLINFNGTTQAITNNSASSIAFQSVTFGNSGTKTLGGSGAFEISNSGTLTMSGTAVLNAAGKLTLRSGSSSTARVAAIPSGASITGNVNVERYLAGGLSTSRGYRLLSSAVSVASNNLILPNLTYLKNQSYLSGTSGTTNGFTGQGNPTLYFYRENLTPVTTSFMTGNQRGVGKINNTNAYDFTIDGDGSTTKTLPAGNGFMFFFRGGPTTTNPTVTSSVAQTATYTSTGYLNQGNITVTHWTGTPTAGKLLYTTASNTDAVRGFNLVGNPYASAIDWDAFGTGGLNGIQGTDVSTTIWTYNPVSKAYTTYVAGTGGVGTNSTGYADIIASGEAFFVRATSANAALTFKEAAKVNLQIPSSNSRLSTAPERDAPLLQYIRVAVIKDSLNREDALVFFKNDAKAEYDLGEDAEYLKGNTTVNMSTMSADKVALAVNQTVFPKKGSTIVPLNVNVPSTGIYKINLDEIKNIPDLYDIWLKDAYTKDSLDIKHNKAYNFNADITKAETYGSGRFTLVVRPNPAYGYSLLDFTAKKASASSIDVAWKTEHEGDYTYFTVERSTDGGKTFNIIASMRGNDLGAYSTTDRDPVKGENIYRLKQEDINGDVRYSNNVSVLFNNGASAPATIPTINVFPNPTTSQISMRVNKGGEGALYTITITNSLGRVMKTTTAASANWQDDITGYLPGTYFIQVVNEKDKSVTGKTSFLKL